MTTLVHGPSRWWRRSAGLLALASLGACSLLFVDGPEPMRPRDQPPSCTDTKAWPAFDLVEGLGGVAAVVLSPLSNWGKPADQRVDGPELAVIGLGSLVLLMAANEGFDRVAACRADEQRFRRHILRHWPPTPVRELAPAPDAGPAPAMTPDAGPLLDATPTPDTGPTPDAAPAPG